MSHALSFVPRCLPWLTVALVLALDHCLPAADRPDVPHLLPESTLALVRVASVPELITQFKETGTGRMLRDEGLEPLFKQLYGSAGEAFAKVQDRVGAGLDDLLSLPQGELCLAVVAPKEGMPAVVVLIEVGDKMPIAQKVLDRVEQEMTAQGGSKSQEAVGKTTLTTYQAPGTRQRRLALFQRDGVITLATDVAVAKQLIATWDGEKSPTLADNTKYSAIMSRCTGAEGDRPQITFFVDPIEIVRRVTRGTAASTVLALLPVLGVDGFQGVGGSLTFNAQEFDTLVHLHVLLDNVRSGVLGVLAMSSGDWTPEAWVPADVVAYRTVYWDFAKSYAELAKVYNSFRGDNALANDVKRTISDRIGIDFEKDFIGAMDNRLTWISWMVKPARLNSQANLVALKLKDAKAFEATLDRVAAKFPEALTKATFGSATYYHAARPQRGPEERKQDPLFREPDPCIAIFAGYLMASDSSEFLHHIIVTRSGGLASLADDLEYKLVASRIRRQPGGEKAGLITFARPEQGMKQMYELATAEETQKRLARTAENNQFMRVVNSALKDNPLPPFATIAKYLAPAGGLMTNDESGFHYMGFSLKRK